MFRTHVDEAITGRFWTDVGSTPVDALTSEDTNPLVAELLVLAKHECDFTSTSTDVTSRNIRVRTDMALELGHESNAEAADFIVTLALRVEVGAALATTHGKARERILERLLEAKELQDRKVNGGVKAKAALVWAKGRVVLE
jgi:hypothetical protein